VWTGLIWLKTGTTGRFIKECVHPDWLSDYKLLKKDRALSELVISRFKDQWILQVASDLTFNKTGNVRIT
jgi:hypothetical protein